MSVIDKLRRRRCYPIEIDGEQVHLRSLLTSEQAQVLQHKDEQSSFGIAIGCCLLHPDGRQVFTRQADEDWMEFGSRVLEALDLPTDTRSQLGQAILKLCNGPPDPAALLKN